jgi:hypothetical protein
VSAHQDRRNVDEVLLDIQLRTKRRVSVGSEPYRITHSRGIAPPGQGLLSKFRIRNRFKAKVGTVSEKVDAFEV